MRKHLILFSSHPPYTAAVFLVQFLCRTILLTPILFITFTIIPHLHLLDLHSLCLSISSILSSCVSLVRLYIFLSFHFLKPKKPKAAWSKWTFPRFSYLLVVHTSIHTSASLLWHTPRFPFFILLCNYITHSESLSLPLSLLKVFLCVCVCFFVFFNLIWKHTSVSESPSDTSRRLFVTPLNRITPQRSHHQTWKVCSHHINQTIRLSIDPETQIDLDIFGYVLFWCSFTALFIDIFL